MVEGKAVRQRVNQSASLYAFSASAHPDPGFRLGCS